MMNFFRTISLAALGTALLLSSCDGGTGSAVMKASMDGTEVRTLNGSVAGRHEDSFEGPIVRQTALPYLKGVCYHPVNVGDTVRDFDDIDRDLALMKAAGINTIRTYSPIDDRAVMDKIAEAGLKVIVGFGYNQKGYYDLLSGTYLDYVEAYKDHDAVLFWELGNEYNYHPEWFDGDLMNWYRVMAAAANVLHQTDPEHAVATAHGELPDSLALEMGADIDIWGLNVYRWDQPATIIDQWKELSDKPFYFSEVGADSYMRVTKSGFEMGVNELAQAHAVDTILEQILDRRSENAGVMIFSYTDGWWKAGHPERQDVGGWAPNSSGVPYDGAPNEEFWGVVDIHRKPKAAYHTVKKHFNAEDEDIQ